MIDFCELDESISRMGLCVLVFVKNKQTQFLKKIYKKYGNLFVKSTLFHKTIRMVVFPL